MQLRGFVRFVRRLGLMGGAVLLAAAPAWPQDTTPPSPPDKASLQVSIQDLQKSEVLELTDARRRLQALESSAETVRSEMQTYRVQNAIHANLLVSPQTQLEDLEEAQRSNQRALNRATVRLREVRSQRTEDEVRLDQIHERIAVVEQEAVRLDRDPGIAPHDRVEFGKTLHDLKTGLEARRQVVDRLVSIEGELEKDLAALITELESTGAQIAQQIQTRAAAGMFVRSGRPLWRLERSVMHENFAQLLRKLAVPFTAAFWQDQWQALEQAGRLHHLVFLLLAVGVLVGIHHLGNTFMAVENRLQGDEFRYRRLVLMLLRRSRLLLGLFFLLEFYDVLDVLYFNINLIRALRAAVLVLAVVRWGQLFLKSGIPLLSPLGEELTNALGRILNVYQAVALTLIAVMLLAGRGSTLVWVLRIVMELLFVMGPLHFWAIHRRTGTAVATDTGSRRLSTATLLIRIWSYTVGVLALLMEITGYGPLAMHWLAAWSKSLLLVFWLWLAFRMAREWQQDFQRRRKQPDEGTRRLLIQEILQGLLIQLVWLTWLAALPTGLLIAWTGPHYYGEIIPRLFGTKVALGSLGFSLAGLLQTAAILCLTHAAASLGKVLINNKIMARPDLERGLKDSVITVTRYVIWGLGLVVALGVMGVDTTSLAVVFGAFSIGIGFGLQNIFNNFISGLILLFERPIQVGDYVEINGQWAEVKKINVRATVVQTFDNASLIIPNSDFISQQVTNWSFKDPRMRRQVDVGVAYGSDTELVRRTLLEIGAATPDVLKYPKPDVLFLDHADSALIFRLRYWTHVDNFFSTSTAIRFAIDRRFRELNIEIAFPQRDIHIRSMAASAPPGAPPSSN